MFRLLLRALYLCASVVKCRLLSSRHVEHCSNSMYVHSITAGRLRDTQRDYKHP